MAPQKEISPSPSVVYRLVCLFFGEGEVWDWKRLTGKVQVADAEFRAFDVDGQEHLTTPRQVLDIAVTTVFRSPRHGPCALPPYLLFDLIGGTTSVHIFRLRRQRHFTVHVGACGDEFTFSPVPFLEDFLRGGAPEDARVDEASETDAGDVAGRAKDAFEIPDGLCSIRIRVSRANNVAVV